MVAQQYLDSSAEHLCCETCGELVCSSCTSRACAHCLAHKPTLINVNLEKCTAEIEATLETAEKQLDKVSDVFKQLEARSDEINSQRVAIENEIQHYFRNVYEFLDKQKARLIDKLDQLVKQKLKNLASQRDELERSKTQLVKTSLSLIRESRMGSQEEIMKMKKILEIIKQIEERTENFSLDICEEADLKFTHSLPFEQSCQYVGDVVARELNCYASGEGLKIAEVGEITSVELHVINLTEKSCITYTPMIVCNFVSDFTGEKVKCSMEKIESNQYEVSYQPTIRGWHHLHIEVDGDHINESPFAVKVKQPTEKVGVLERVISGVNKPTGVTVNKKCEVIIAEEGGHCVSILSPTGEFLRSLGHGQLNNPRGVAVNSDGNILVADGGNNCITMFTYDGRSNKSIGTYGHNSLEFKTPSGVDIHPITKMVYVADYDNHRIQVLSPDLRSSTSFGSFGSINGQFNKPWDVAFDSNGDVYIVDSGNHRIQVFTVNGEYLRKFGNCGEEKGELFWPSSIHIDSDDMVYVTEDGNHRVSVFTSEGIIKSVFGTHGGLPGQLNLPHGIAVDKNGYIYVSDHKNNRLQIF